MNEKLKLELDEPEQSNDVSNICADESLEIDGIIVATISPDYMTPSVACLLQERLNTRKIFAFDVSAGCSGFIYCLNIAKAMIENGQTKKLLIAGAENLSKIVDYTDRGTCILFGDGAGGVKINLMKHIN